MVLWYDEVAEWGDEFYERMATPEELVHFGTPRHSGRYPWGSGEAPFQTHKDFKGYVKQLRDQGLSDEVIAKGLGVNPAELNIKSTEFRAKHAIAVAEQRAANASMALQLQDRGMGPSAIGRQMGLPESTVRSLLNPANAERRTILQTTAKQLQDKVDKDGFLDVGRGTEADMGISKTRLDTAVAYLKEKGYPSYNVRVPQQFGKGKTTIKVLAPPGTTWGDVARNMNDINSLGKYTPNKGRLWDEIEPPAQVSSKRIGVRWKEDGGGDADGVIYVRPGVPDVSLGRSRYMQVRIAVDGTHFLKGMAMYKDDMPAGTDLLFNTSKSKKGATSKLDAMKELKEEDRPFKSVVRQMKYVGPDGKEHLSAMNIVNDQGDWYNWRPTLSSQILSKQSTELAKRQLDLDYAQKKNDFDQIMALTNPTLKNKLLRSFADEADSDAVHLKAAALPRQRSHVILPIKSLKEDEIYAPQYRNGEVVALIRHPHGGVFEIPELRVNNKNREAISALTKVETVNGKTIRRAPEDAVAIHPSVARRLSGADFDGDAVLVIPNRSRAITTKPPLKDLLNFDPQTSYPEVPGMKYMSKRGKQQHMGDVSNLITDMTIKGAGDAEIARAVKHSMVVIDAENHKLNYEQSYKDFGIRELKARYQGVHSTGRASGRVRGASTIISRAGSEIRINKRIPRPARRGGPIDPKTGRRVYEETGETYHPYNKKTGQYSSELKRTQTKIKRLAYEEDARNLLSDNPTPMERLYADHSNNLKTLANQARYESLRTGKLKYSTTAFEAYRPQVARLNAALNIAKKNAPLERQAQIVARSLVAARVHDNPALKDDPDDMRKVRYQALRTARERIVGSHKEQIKISSDEWDAIQAGAISHTKLLQILDNANLDQVKALATPRQVKVMTGAKLSYARALLNSGYTQAEVAERLGISVSTLANSLK